MGNISPSNRQPKKKKRSSALAYNLAASYFAMGIVNKERRDTLLNPITPTTIHQAAREGSVEQARKILDRFFTESLRKKEINRQDENKLSALHYAAKYHDLQVMDFAINNGADVHQTGSDMLLTPL